MLRERLGQSKNRRTHRLSELLTTTLREGIDTSHGKACARCPEQWLGSRNSSGFFLRKTNSIHSLLQFCNFPWSLTQQGRKEQVFKCTESSHWRSIRNGSDISQSVESPPPVEGRGGKGRDPGREMRNDCFHACLSFLRGPASMLADLLFLEAATLTGTLGRRTK